MARPTTAESARKFQQRAANSSALPSIENTEAPDYLPQAGKDLWNALLPELARNGAKAIDTTAFSYLCLSHGLAVESAKTLQQEGLLVADRGDSTKKNPAFQTLRDADLLPNFAPANIEQLSISANSLGSRRASLPCGRYDLASLEHTGEFVRGAIV